MMSSPETGPTSRDVLLDFHVGVAKADDLRLIAVLDAYSRLLCTTGGTPRLVQGMAITWARHDRPPVVRQEPVPSTLSWPWPDLLSCQ